MAWIVTAQADSILFFYYSIIPTSYSAVSYSYWQLATNGAVKIYCAVGIEKTGIPRSFQQRGVFIAPFPVANRQHFGLFHCALGIFSKFISAPLPIIV
jgi:hypothetical protein